MDDSAQMKYILLGVLAGLFSQSLAQNPVFHAPPAWSKGVVWYQIFPDRFWNGDTLNDPPLGAQQDAWPHDTLRPWKLHPWTSDWYKLQPWEKSSDQDLWYNITRRRYGGDLSGILQRLDYLESLGVQALYINPIFYAPSHHRYDAYMLHHVDPYLGPNPAADLALIATEKPDDPSTWHWTSADTLALHLVGEVHRRGMRIIWDGVFNHMGVGNPFFVDVIQNQQASPYADWFEVEQWRDVDSGKAFRYKGWFGIQDLPEFKENQNGLTAGPDQYIHDITQRWMRPTWSSGVHPRDAISLGIDGWRLDVAFCVAHPFWKRWSARVREWNTEAYLTAEVIDEAPKLKPYLRGDEFDAVMNYPFAFIASEYLINDRNRPSTLGFQKQMDDLIEVFGYDRFLSQQNLFGSHDANRLASHIVNRNFAKYAEWGSYFALSKASNPAYNTRKPNGLESKIQAQWMVFQLTFPGAPMLYYGDEVGMWGANDPDCRKPMLWPELKFEDEWHRPDQSLYPQAQVVQWDTTLLQLTKDLISLRKTHRVLRDGAFRWLRTKDNKEILGYERYSPAGGQIMVFLNPTDQTQSFSGRPFFGKAYAWPFSGVFESESGDFHLPPRGYVLFQPR